MLKAIDMGWFVLNKYYTMSDDVPVYAAALLLDPTKRAAYLMKNWPEEWHEGSIGAAREIWEKEYNQDVELQQPDHPVDVNTSADEEEDEFDRLRKATNVQPDEPSSTCKDDFDAFISTGTTALDKGCTPLQWWCRIQQRVQYPRLSRMAIDILSIPAESAEAERTFSGARRTTRWDRLRITPQNLEKVECIGNWLREEHIKPASEGGMGLVGEPEGSEDDMSIDQE
jgi:hypothetical protein